VARRLELAGGLLDPLLDLIGLLYRPGEVVRDVRLPQAEEAAALVYPRDRHRGAAAGTLEVGPGLRPGSG
jgi:hypothetical protein